MHRHLFDHTGRAIPRWRVELWNITRIMGVFVCLVLGIVFWPLWLVGGYIGWRMFKETPSRVPHWRVFLWRLAQITLVVACLGFGLVFWPFWLVALHFALQDPDDWA